MTTTRPNDLANHVISTLRAHQADVRQAGIRHISLFGSVARGDAITDSDVDLAAELDPTARIGLLALSALERHLGQLVGRKVDLLPEQSRKPAFERTSTETAYVPSSRVARMSACSCGTGILGML